MPCFDVNSQLDWSAFDVAWYKRTYGEVMDFFNITTDDGVREFYAEYGGVLKHSPNLFFDEKWYVCRYADVSEKIKSGEVKSGFEHYSKIGFWDRNPHWLFDEEYYRKNFLNFPRHEIEENGFRNGYDHYLKEGSRLNCSSSPFFDPNFLLTEAPDFEVDPKVGAYVSFLRSFPDSRLNNKKLSWYFDPIWYQETYSDLVVHEANWKGPLYHYLTNSTPQRFNPNAFFSEKFYAQAYEDVAGAVSHGVFRNCYEHFVKCGQYELRQPEANVDLRLYAENPKVKSEISLQKYPSFFVYYIAHGGVVEECGYSLEEREFISKSVYLDMCRIRLPQLLQHGIDFSYDKPELSVIIIAHNNFSMTMSALYSLRSNYKGQIQVILVDSGSSDRVCHIERYVRGVKFIRALGNVGFLRGCNMALEHVEADFTLYLNNDLELMPYAVETALVRFAKEPRAGAVGAKLIRTNGVLQEAGSIIWNNGSVCGYLRDQDPNCSEANYVRSVDFCSGAFLMVRTDILRNLNGFLEDYAPAYFEETDLCVRLRQNGWDVVYDPGVEVIHYEYGTSSNTGSLSMMRINQGRFIENNRNYLASCYPREKYLDIFARSVDKFEKRILFIEDFLPFRHLGSGFTRSNDIVTVMAEKLNCHVTVYPIFCASEEMQADVYAGFPDRVEVIYDKGLENLDAFLKSRPDYYDTIWIARTHNASRVMPIFVNIREVLGKCKIVLDTEAIAAPREIQKLKLKGEIPQHSLNELLQKEFSAVQSVNTLVAVNAKDAGTLHRLGYQDVHVLGHLQQAQRFTPGFKERHDILFIGAIHDADSPNLDSLIWFVTEVLPKLDGHLPEDVKFRICGYLNPNVDISLLYLNPRVDVVGRVESVSDYYNTHRVFVAPTRFAGGIPYKIHEAAAHGIPIVGSDILCEQIGWQPNEDMLAPEVGNAAAFAAAIIDLYNERELWQKLRYNILQRIKHENTIENYVSEIKNILS